VYTSAQSPGLIYDVLAVNPATLASRRADYTRLIKVWDRVVSYINDPKTQDDAVQIMAQRVGVSPAQYKQLLSGTHLINVADAKKVLVKAEGLGSLYGSTQNADDFNVHNAVYKQPQKVDGYIEPSLTLAQP
jgi:NitT/TauT family transport system substrate-binding protein